MRMGKYEEEGRLHHLGSENHRKSNEEQNVWESGARREKRQATGNPNGNK